MYRRKMIRPIVSRSYGPNIFPANNFRFESSYAGIIFTAKFFRPYFFRFES